MNPGDALLDAVHDLITHRSHNPFDALVEVAVSHVECIDWEATLVFQSGDTITVNFELVAPTGLAPAIRQVWLDSLLLVAAAIDRDLPTLGHTRH